MKDKKNRKWIWLALDTDTKEVIGAHIGKRDSEAAKKLWASLPPIYRQCAVIYTDYWDAYNVFPCKRHKALHLAVGDGYTVGKHTGLTNHIERLNNTFRQRIGRIVRNTLSFSKNIDNHIGAIWNFIHCYNKNLFIT